MADLLLEEIVCDVERMKDTSLESGLSGIGWGVNYAIQNSFVDADEEVLDELENYLFTEDWEFIDIGSTFTFCHLQFICYLNWGKPRSQFPMTTTSLS